MKQPVQNPVQKYVQKLLALMVGDAQADRVVPPTGFTARLTVLAAAAMAFLAVFALALSLATGRLASRWSDALTGTATIRITAPEDQMEAQVAAVLKLLETTPGIGNARLIGRDEQAALLTPWFGPDLPLDSLPLPALVEITEDGNGYNPDGLSARLAGEAPGAVLDDHSRWRAPLVRAAGRLRALGWFAMLLITATTALIITLATSAALAANAQVIRVLRLVGAQDAYIAGAFMRRYTTRAFMGALGGTLLGALVVLLLPGNGTGVAGDFLTGIGFTGADWLWLLLIPLLAALVAFGATRYTSLATLKERS